MNKQIALVLATATLLSAAHEHCFMHIKFDCPRRNVVTGTMRVPLGLESTPQTFSAISQQGQPPGYSGSQNLARGEAAEIQRPAVGAAVTAALEAPGKEHHHRHHEEYPTGAHMTEPTKHAHHEEWASQVPTTATEEHHHHRHHPTGTHMAEPTKYTRQGEWASQVPTTATEEHHHHHHHHKQEEVAAPTIMPYRPEEEPHQHKSGHYKRAEEHAPFHRSQSDIDQLSRLAFEVDRDMSDLPPQEPGLAPPPAIKGVYKKQRPVEQIVPDLLYTAGIAPDVMTQFPEDDQEAYIKATVDLVDAFQAARRRSVRGEVLKDNVVRLLTYASTTHCKELARRPWEGDVFTGAQVAALVCSLGDIEKRGRENAVVARRLRKRQLGMPKMLALAHLLSPSDYSRYLHTDVTKEQLTKLYREAIRELTKSMPHDMMHAIKPREPTLLEAYHAHAGGLKTALLGYMTDADYAKASQMIRELHRTKK